MDPTKKPRATYRDLIESPAHMVAEIIGGELRLSNRPATPSTAAVTTLGNQLGPPFHHGSGGPGGWLILRGPELHLGDDIVVPDLAGWRRERVPTLPDTTSFTLAPDWLCEVSSPSTARVDRMLKMPLYLKAKVAHVWLVDPIAEAIDVFRNDGKAWTLVVTVGADMKARIEPFDAAELDLARLWDRGEPPK
jgi:Uma2 family endonuclease